MALTLASLLLIGCDHENSGQAHREPRAIQLIEVAGQSNAGLGGFDATRETRALFPNVRQFGNGAKAGLGFLAQDEHDLVSLEPAHDDAVDHGQYIATMAGFAFGVDRSEYIVRTDWFGGQPIQSFTEGTINFRNTLQAVRAAKLLVGEQPIVCPWYIWIQGESGPGDRELYGQQLRSYIASIVPAIAKELNQAVGPTFVILQTNTGDLQGDGTGQYNFTGPDNVGLAQWDVAQSTPGVILAGPTYQAPIIWDISDNIHNNSLGRMIIGDMLAAVKAAGPKWKPLQPLSAVLVDDSIFIRFEVPAGPLAWDTSWIAPAPNFGFSYIDDQRSAVITEVTIVSKNTVRIVLSNPPTGDHKTIRYAQEEVDHQLDGWSGARGQLISPTKRVSLFWSLGHPVPRFVNHYSIKFAMPVTERTRPEPIDRQ